MAAVTSFMCVNARVVQVHFPALASLQLHEEPG